eukprot:CAMPEP_0177617446 /NCGR_PEP_ID=MMETSP0419_2-20121207/24882_1 /TAXON_ID=582737 /ORGANISM="Tetraselmis sp., Strain GSL018" /LENGTH=43 /DNA_ID= /DNA_START= /DNA_END= /DNA_ORIENTATION=
MEGTGIPALLHQGMQQGGTPRTDPAVAQGHSNHSVSTAATAGA